MEVESWQLGSTRLLALAWAEADTSPAIREMLLRRRREIHGVTVGLLQEGIARGEFPAWLDIDHVAAGLGALIDGVILQSIEEGAGYRRSESERRVLAMIELLIAAATVPASPRLEAVPPRATGGQREQAARDDRPGSGPDGPRADRTGLPRLDAAPRAHRDRALARPGPLGLLGAASRPAVIVEELFRFREAGGGTLVDLTLPGVGREPAWLVRLSEATGLNIVMGAGWYRDAYYPVETLIDRRSVDSLADEIVREATDGVGESGVRPGIIGEIGTDKPWISAREERVHRAAARAARRTGLAITTHAVQSTVGLDQLDVFEAEGADLSRVVVGHADLHPSFDYHLAIVERGATVEFDFLGMSFTPLERHGEGRIVESICELLAEATSSACCCRRMSATTPSSPLRRQRLRLPRRDVPAAPPRCRRLRRRDPDDHVRQPEAAPDDRVERPPVDVAKRSRVERWRRPGPRGGCPRARPHGLICPGWQPNSWSVLFRCLRSPRGRLTN